VEFFSSMEKCLCIYRELLMTQLYFLVSSMRGYTSCWDSLWLDPVDSWIQSQCEYHRLVVVRILLV
jgi:hypothetical protein